MYLALFEHGHIVVESKGKVRFAAAKIQDRKRLIRRKLLFHIQHHFQKTVDLSEFVLLPCVYFSLGIHDTKIH